jgi:hypothetical protein
VTNVAVVWLVVALVSTTAVLAVLIALVRHTMILGRSLKRFQQEVGPLAEEIGAQGDRAAGRAQRLEARGSGQPRGRAVR